MKRNVILLWLSCFFGMNAFSQNAPKIQRAYAFYTVNTPGMIMQDDKGNPVDPVVQIDRLIYIECPGTKSPDIKTVSYNNVPYTPTISKVNETTVHVGTKGETGKEIILSAKKGNSFWKMKLQLTNDQGKAPRDIKRIVIQGKYNKRLYNFYVYNETQLFAPPRY